MSGDLYSCECIERVAYHIGGSQRHVFLVIEGLLPINRPERGRKGKRLLLVEAAKLKVELSSSFEKSDYDEYESDEGEILHWPDISEEYRWPHPDTRSLQFALRRLSG